jgi:hypothetical protein
VIVAGAFACGIALVLALRGGGGPGDVAPPAVATSQPGEPRAAPPAKLPSNAAKVEAPGAASAAGSAAPVTRALIPARKPARASAVPPKKAASPSGKRSAGSGDIVDPWAH